MSSCVGGLAGSTVFSPAVGIGLYGVMLAGIAKSELLSKTEMCRYVSTGYQKVLNQLKTYLRGEVYDKTHLMHELNTMIM